MDRSNNRQRTALICSLLAIATLAAYVPVLHNDFVKYDDRQYVTDNPYVLNGLTWSNVKWAFSPYAANWHPVTWLSHMLDVQLFGLRPGWHHLVSLLFHAANTVLLFLLLQGITGARWRSALVAGLFALHPLHVESVAWLAERKDVLSAFFFLLTLMAYARYVETSNVQPPKSKAGETGPRDERRGQGEDGPPAQPSATADSRLPGLRTRHSALATRWPLGFLPPSMLGPLPAFYFLLALVFFALGLMSKPMLVTLPFVLLLLDFWPLRRVDLSCLPQQRATIHQLLWEKVPFLGLSALSCLLTFLAQAGGHAVTHGLPLGLRTSNAIAACWRYLGKTFWPADLAVFYPHPGLYYFAPQAQGRPAGLGLWPVWLVAAAALALVAVSLWAGLRLARRPWFATGWFWYLGMLAPVLGFVQIGMQAMADRYTYLPLIGVFIGVVWGLGAVVGASRVGRLSGATAGILALAVCGVLTQRQVRYWKNDLTLFEHTLEVTRQNAVAECRLGGWHGEQGQFELAAAHFRRALEIDPNFGEAYYGLGVTAELQGNLSEAVAQFRAALRVRPWFDFAYDHLGVVLWKLGQREEALKEYAQALELNPNNPEAHFHVGLALSENNRLAEAAAEFAEAVRLKPNYVEALDRLAEALLKQGRLAEVAARYRQLVRLNPESVDAHINLGGVLWRLGRRDEAMAQYKAAVQVAPTHPLAHYNLGTALLAQGRAVDAWMQFLEAVRLKPDYIEALTELGKVAVVQEDFDEAQARFQEVVRLCPTNANYRVNLGNALRLAGLTNEATASFSEALRLEPDLVERLVQAGKTLVMQGDPDTAIARFRTALLVKPDDPSALTSLAWVLATHRLERVRDGDEAVELAERACASKAGTEARSWTTLAAAYAEAERFDEAVTAGEKARDMALAAGDKQAAQAAEARLALYRKHQPFHQ